MPHPDPRTPRPQRRPLVALALCALLPGCLMAGGGNRIEFDEDIRLPVRFASPAACEAFHAGLDLSDRAPFTRGRGFYVLLLAGGGERVFHETQHWNAQVRRADADADGTITEDEATRYRASVG